MHQPHFIIRDAIEADVPAILKMHARSWLATYPAQRVGAIYVDVAYHGTGLAQRLIFKEQENSEHIVHTMIPVITMIRKGDK